MTVAMVAVAGNFDDWMHTVHAKVEQELSACLPAAVTVPQRLHAAMRYALLGGGKRVRPLLVFAAGALFDAEPQALSRAAVRTSSPAPSSRRPNR